MQTTQSTTHRPMATQNTPWHMRYLEVAVVVEEDEEEVEDEGEVEVEVEEVRGVWC